MGPTGPMGIPNIISSLEGTDYDQRTTMTSSSHAHDPLGLAAAVSTCADQQFGTNFNRICEAQTLGNSLNVG